jgi:hypothetical protein
MTGLGYKTTEVPVDAARTWVGAELGPSRIGFVAEGSRRSDGLANVIGGWQQILSCGDARRPASGLLPTQEALMRSHREVGSV